MSIARLTRTVTFRAAHRYHRPEWDEAENARRFGKCAREHGHGHTYRCRVTIQGTLNEDTAMVMDLGDLDALLDIQIVDVLDHRHLNHDVPEFAYGNTVPTCEALAVHIWGRLEDKLPGGVHLHAVRVDEEETLFAEYFGE